MQKTAGFLVIIYPLPLHIDPTLTAQGGITTPPPVRFTRFWNRMYKNSWLFTHSISTPPPHRPHFEQPRGRSVGTDLAVHFGSICRGEAEVNSKVSPSILGPFWDQPLNQPSLQTTKPSTFVGTDLAVHFGSICKGKLK